MIQNSLQKMQKIPANTLHTIRNQNVYSLNSSPRQICHAGMAPSSSMLIFENSKQMQDRKSDLRNVYKQMKNNKIQGIEQRNSSKQIQNSSILEQRSSSLNIKHVKHGSSHINTDSRIFDNTFVYPRGSVLVESSCQKQSQYQNKELADYQIGSHYKQKIMFGRKRCNNTATLKKISSNPSNKLSMKHVESESTMQYQETKQFSFNNFHQVPLSQSIQSSCVQQKSENEIHEIVRHFQRQIQAQKKKLLTEIQNQSSVIHRLSQSLTILGKELQNREKKITELEIMVQQQREFCKEKLSELQKIIGRITYEIYPKNAQVQSHINSKIDLIEQKILSLQKCKQNGKVLESLSISMKNIFDQLSGRINRGWIADLQKIRRFLESPLTFESNLLMKESESTQSAFEGELSETAKFQSQNMQNPENVVLDDSQTYFFHPSEFQSHQQISQLLELRRSQTDKENRLKYWEIGGSVFDKRGKPSKLTQSQMKRYKDCSNLLYEPQFAKF